MKLVILDRDGTINFDSERFIKTPEEWRPIPGALDAIARLNAAGYHVAVATNQSGIERGLLDMSALNAIHAKMLQAVQDAGGRIDAIYYCPHSGDADCRCRKPGPGMFIDIGQRLGVALDAVPCIGDGLRDLQAAAAAGARPMLVLTGKGASTLAAGGLPPGTEVFANLAVAVDAILTREPTTATR
ncbi:MAG: D-glycero-beta-D-manno-heptose 1,7-bisphosphate 7-phosphatase [Burkholderiales bacterium]|nr:D-glycero-beta-D-manno-heptose 1,7-bisphosphate 7-phosphatase [Burkholderiales bacterium]MCZ2136426.1 D-glycero-beta-D-manno-heptose 1,7-bisphosphate 7-phosphatase [Burkholderiales bacterium]